MLKYATMIKFAMLSAQGKRVLGLALSRRNTQRLLKKEPIDINVAELFPDRVIDRIVLCAAETEEEIEAELREAGLIREETRVTKGKGPMPS